MNVDALLCDAVTIRDGLLHLLGGGVTRLFRETFPAPLGASLALQITATGSEVGASHSIRIRLHSNQNDVSISEIMGDFEIVPADEFGDDYVAVCFAIGLAQVPIPEAGRYALDIYVNGELARTLRFVARLNTGPISVAPTRH